MKFLKDEEGVVLIEYGLIAVLIGVFCILVLTALGVQLETLFQSIIDVLNPISATPGTPPAG